MAPRSLTIAAALTFAQPASVAHATWLASPMNGVANECYNILRSLVDRPEDIDTLCATQADPALCAATRFAAKVNDLSADFKAVYNMCLATFTGATTDYCASILDWRVDALLNAKKSGATCDRLCMTRKRLDALVVLSPAKPADVKIREIYDTCTRVFKNGANEVCDTIAGEAATGKCPNCDKTLPPAGKYVENWLASHRSMSIATQKTFLKCKNTFSVKASTRCYTESKAKPEINAALAGCSVAGVESKAACEMDVILGGKNDLAVVGVEECSKAYPAGLAQACVGIVENGLSVARQQEIAAKCLLDEPCRQREIMADAKSVSMVEGGPFPTCKAVFAESKVASACGSAMVAAIKALDGGNLLAQLNTVITGAGAACDTQCKYQKVVSEFASKVKDSTKVSEVLKKCRTPADADPWEVPSPLS